MWDSREWYLFVDEIVLYLHASLLSVLTLISNFQIIHWFVNWNLQMIKSLLQHQLLLSTRPIMGVTFSIMFMLQSTYLLPCILIFIALNFVSYLVPFRNSHWNCHYVLYLLASLLGSVDRLMYKSYHFIILCIHFLRLGYYD